MSVIRTRIRLALALVMGIGCARIASSQPASPTIEGPITSPGVPFVATTSFDLAQVGYEQAEYFISGTATAYTNTGPLGEDGRWSVAPADTAAYKTRILVYRPTNRKKFRGTVVVEWLNVRDGGGRLAAWDRGVDEAAAAEELILWFEHDLFDQLAARPAARPARPAWPTAATDDRLDRSPPRGPALPRPRPARARAARRAVATSVPLIITPLGRQALAGAIDRVHEAGIDDWRGGVHLAGRGPVWRWDSRQRKLLER